MTKVLSKWLLILFLLSGDVFATAPVTLSVAPQVATVGSQIRVLVRVEPNAANRQLIVEWYIDEGFENRKFEQLDGADAPRMHQYWIILREPGEWTFRAIVKHNNGTSTVIAGPVRIIGGF